MVFELWEQAIKAFKKVSAAATFSDSDINEAWLIVANMHELTDEQKQAFIDAFQKGWKEIKNTAYSSQQINYHKFFEGIFNDISIGLKNVEDLMVFANALGSLMCLFTHMPRMVISYPNYITTIIKELRKKPEFYRIIEIKIKEWSREIEIAIRKNEITADEKKKYRSIRSRI